VESGYGEDREPPDPLAQDYSEEAASDSGWFGNDPQDRWGYDWLHREGHYLTEPHP
jgi:hypothetical protein